MVLGHIFNKSTSAVYDEVLAVFMPGPFSFTGEDVIEIQAHGGSVVLNSILNLVLSQGARLAEPGEFTMRAFRNGRLDLAQAEAVFELTQARTSFGAQAAAAQLAGALSSEIAAVKDSIEDILCLLAASVDFPDDVDEISPQAIISRLETEIIPSLSRLVAHARKNEIARTGINAVILGRPNVGKSSLLNMLLGKDRAIVSSSPGTTRDSISEETLLAGRHAILWDTAGLRLTDDPVELLGIERSKRALNNADTIILVIEAHNPFIEEDIEILRLLAGRKVIIAANKADLLNGSNSSNFPSSYGLYPVVTVSALEYMGAGALAKALWEVAGVDPAPDPSQGLMNVRQRHNAEQALTVIEESVSKARIHFLPEFLSIDLERALNNLGMITGETATPDVLEAIFSRFCIGK